MLPPEDSRPEADSEGAVKAEAGPKNPPRPRAEVTERLSEMRWVLGGFERALVLTHDNPDPDAIASAAGLAHGPTASISPHRHHQSEIF